VSASDGTPANRDIERRLDDASQGAEADTDRSEVGSAVVPTATKRPDRGVSDITRARERPMWWARCRRRRALLPRMPPVHPLGASLTSVYPPPTSRSDPDVEQMVDVAVATIPAGFAAANGRD
jgi:hypothetical protein